MPDTLTVALADVLGSAARCCLRTLLGFFVSSGKMRVLQCWGQCERPHQPEDGRGC